jgi:hypothetical protein
MAAAALPGPYYTELLRSFHQRLKPRTYLETGVASGKTIVLAAPGTRAVGVDPQPKIAVPLGPNVAIVQATSDAFFARPDAAALFGGLPLDLAFIDGMHHFEYALRDFAGAERLAHPRATIVLHDCYPLDRLTAERERRTVFWSGDCWRAVLALKKYRPDLLIATVATAPTGLALIRRLDPGSRVLTERMDAIVAEFLAVDYGVLEADKAGMLNLVPNDAARIGELLDS